MATHESIVEEMVGVGKLRYANTHANESRAADAFPTLHAIATHARPLSTHMRVARHIVVAYTTLVAIREYV